MGRTISPVFTWRSAIARSDLPSTTKLVALVLSLYMSELGDSAYPAVGTIAEGASVSTSTAREHLKVLEAKGWLRVARTKGGMASGAGVEGRAPAKTNRYEAVVPHPPAAGGLTDSPPPGSGAPTPRETVPHPPAAGGDHEVLDHEQHHDARPRARTPNDDLFDALATAEGIEEGQRPTDLEAKRIGTALARIRRAWPDVTPAGLLAVIAEARRMSWTSFTAMAIASNLGRLREAARRRAAADAREDRASETFRRVMGDGGSKEGWGPLDG